MVESAEWSLFDEQTPEAPATVPATSKASADGRKNEAKRSIRYMAEMALRYGKVTGLADLLDRVAAFHQYSPYNALLVLLQRPAASYVLPSHAWGERYGRVIRPNEQPLVMLQPQGPVMFLWLSRQECGSCGFGFVG